MELLVNIQEPNLKLKINLNSYVCDLTKKFVGCKSRWWATEWSGARNDADVEWADTISRITMRPFSDRLVAWSTMVNSGRLAVNVYDMSLTAR